MCEIARNPSRWLRVLVASAIGILIAGARVHAANDDLVQTLILQNQATLDRIRSAEYRIDIEDAYNGHPPVKMRADVKRQGSSLWFERTRPIYNRTTKATSDYSIRGIRNNDATAFWMVGDANGYLFPNDAGAAERELRTQEKVNVPLDVLMAPFGDMHYYLRDLRKWKANWEAEERPGKDRHSTYILTYKIPQYGGAGAELEIDPALDFVVTRRTARDGAGHVLAESSYLFERVGSDRVPFPVKLNERTYHDGQLARERTYSVSRISVGHPIPAEQFEPSALGLGDHNLLTANSRGEWVQNKIEDGKIIPINVWLSLHPPVAQKANANTSVTPREMASAVKTTTSGPYLALVLVISVAGMAGVVVLIKKRSASRRG